MGASKETFRQFFSVSHDEDNFLPASRPFYLSSSTPRILVFSDIFCSHLQLSLRISAARWLRMREGRN